MRKKLFSTILLLSVLSGGLVQVKADNVLADLVEMDYSGKADTLTTALIRQFMNQSQGYFWAVPSNQPNKENVTFNIYWQQAHAMDVVVYSYERIKDSNATLATRYLRYMGLWYKNHAHNYEHADNDPTGFVNTFTDDMCWICLTLLHMSEATGDDKYADTVKTLFDNYIEPRGWKDTGGFWGLPWKSDNRERNACTNAPGCLVACKLYEKYGDEKYLNRAIDIYNYQTNEMKVNLNNDGRVEDPPLTYTQGTFGEACRHLYHITGDDTYLKMGSKVIQYLCSATSRCTYQGLLRDEGTSMDQSIFKAVCIPYIVNMVLDENVPMSYRRLFVIFLQKNAKKLWENLNLSKYPATYCNYYWGEPFDESTVASMGAMTSGASLMEGVARMCLALTADKAAIDGVEMARSHVPYIYTLDGRKVHSDKDTDIRSLPSGFYIVDGRKVIVR